MPRDNFQHLFTNTNKTKTVDDANPSSSLGTADAVTSAASSDIDISSPSDTEECTRSAAAAIDGSNSDDFTAVDPPARHDTATTPNSTPTTNSKPGTESIAYLKRFVSPALQNIRDLKLADRMNALADNLDDYPERVRRELETRTEERRRRRRAERVAAMDHASGPPGAGISEGKRSDEEMEEECRKLKVQADEACRRIGERYDALARFVQANPHGRYEDFVEFLLVESTAKDVAADGCAELMEENFYANDSECRKLWNDNLTLGLGEDCTTLEGRVFVPENDTNNDPWQDVGQQSQSIPTQHPQTASGDRVRQISQIDGQKIASSAFNVLANVSTYAMKPLRDLQLAEKVNAMQLDLEEEEARREIQRYNQKEEERRDLEHMMAVKREAEERTLALTKDHLMEFVRARPGATYQEWIEDLHPENAHDGALLEGFGKTIDHRFFVEESDHRRLWNDHLTVFLDDGESRVHVPPRPRQMDENGELVVADDLLSGSGDAGNNGDALSGVASRVDEGSVSLNSNNADLIAFD